jgi:hypothetical protein
MRRGADVDQMLAHAQAQVRLQQQLVEQQAAGGRQLLAFIWRIVSGSCRKGFAEHPANFRLDASR